MNRKDIIIVAVLINMGLLVTLFISAQKSEKSSKIVVNEKPKEESILVKPNITKSLKGIDQSDQIDQVLSQYSAKTTNQEKKENEKVPSSSFLAVKKEIETKTPFTEPIENQIKIFTVKKGDVLEKIARFNGVSVDEIMKINCLSNTRLQIGQKIKIPKKNLVEQTKQTSNVDDKSYIVKNGDSPWSIAQEQNMQVEELLHLNGMDKEKAKHIRPGDSLKIK